MQQSSGAINLTIQFVRQKKALVDQELQSASNDMRQGLITDFGNLASLERFLLEPDENSDLKGNAEPTLKNLMQEEYNSHRLDQQQSIGIERGEGGFPTTQHERNFNALKESYLQHFHK